MKILGNRLLVSKVEAEAKTGFEAVELQDSFIYKGMVEKISSTHMQQDVKLGDIVLFAKYSPDTQEVEHEGKKMKIVSVGDVLAII